MPKYYFNVRDGDTVVMDNQGIELPDLKSAFIEAEASARELLSERIKFGEPFARTVVEVTNDLDGVVFNVSLRSVLRLD